MANSQKMAGPSDAVLQSIAPLFDSEDLRLIETSVVRYRNTKQPVKRPRVTQSVSSDVVLMDPLLDDLAALFNAEDLRLLETSIAQYKTRFYAVSHSSYKGNFDIETWGDRCTAKSQLRRQAKALTRKRKRDEREGRVSDVTLEDIETLNNAPIPPKLKRMWLSNPVDKESSKYWVDPPEMPPYYTPLSGSDECVRWLTPELCENVASLVHGIFIESQVKLFEPDLQRTRMDTRPAIEYARYLELVIEKLKLVESVVLKRYRATLEPLSDDAPPTDIPPTGGPTEVEEIITARFKPMISKFEGAYTRLEDVYRRHRATLSLQITFEEIEEDLHEGFKNSWYCRNLESTMAKFLVSETGQ